MPPRKSSSPRKAAAPAAPPKEMPSGGTSKPTQQAKSNQQAKGDSFLKYIKEHDADLSARWGTDWASVPEGELTQESIWGHFASYLADVYIIPAGEKNGGEHLKVKSAHGVWGGLIFQARGALAKSTRLETKVCILRARSARAPSAMLNACSERSERAFVRVLLSTVCAGILALH